MRNSRSAPLADDAQVLDLLRWCYEHLGKDEWTTAAVVDYLVAHGFSTACLKRKNREGGPRRPGRPGHLERYFLGGPHA